MDTIGYLPDDILVKVDRASMAASLETRVPLLDHSLLEFAWTLPWRARVRDGGGKWMLRQVLARYLPRTLFERPKQGFAIPLAAWLRGPLREWAGDLLARPDLALDGLLDSRRVRRAFADHQSGRRDRAHLLWTVLMLQSWRLRWGA